MMEDNQDQGYPWPLLFRTILLLNGIFVIGIFEGVRGPSLLDLKDIIGASLSQTSFIFMLSSIGSLIGSFLIGAFLDKLSRFRYLILSSTLVIVAFTIALIPFSPNIIFLYAISFLFGIASGALDIGSNVLILDIWKGRDSGPYMHSLHFLFGVGCFLGPVFVRPFLMNEANDTEIVTDTEEANQTENIMDALATETERGLGNSLWTIKTLFPMIGCYSFLISLWFLGYFINDWRNPTRMEKKKEGENNRESMSKKQTYLIIFLMSLFFFFYVGLEVAYGTFVSVFAVKSSLRFSRKQGSDVAALFWGTFAAARGVSIFTAIVASPGVIMLGSFVFCIAGSLVLSVWALEEAGTYLYLGTALLGVGCASIFATGFLWLERRMVVTNRIGSCIAIASSAGADVFPVLVGQLVEQQPMVFMYLMSGTVVSCILMFACISLLARHFSRRNSDVDENVSLKSTNEEK